MDNASELEFQVVDSTPANVTVAMGGGEVGEDYITRYIFLVDGLLMSESIMFKVVTQKCQ